MMPERSNLDQLVADNPKIDKGQLERSRELRDRLQRTGRAGPRYRLASPSTHRRVGVRGDAGADSRAVRIGRRP